MSSGLLARSRAMLVCACAATAVGIGGCTAGAGSSVTASGKTLTIYGSAQAGSTNPQLAQDILDAEQLALQQSGTTVNKFTLRFRRLTAGRLSDNARKAIEDKSTIAYLGEIDPGASADSLGITNAVDILQVSPTDTAIALTQKTSAVPGAPDDYYESLKTYGRTFARVVPNGVREAKAQAQEMQSLGVKSLYITSDGSDYGKAIALSVKNAAAAAGIGASSSQSGADAVFDGAASASSAQRVFASAAAANPAVKLFAPSALDTAAFASGLGAGKLRLYVSAPGFLRKDLTSSGQKFVADFTATYGHAPAAEAIFGYEAMAGVVSALREAGKSANDRSTVVKDFFGVRNRSSVLGTYSIDGNGDTSLGAFVFSRLSQGKLVPFKSVQIPG